MPLFLFAAYHIIINVQIKSYAFMTYYVRVILVKSRCSAFLREAFCSPASDETGIMYKNSAIGTNITIAIENF